MSHAPHHLGVPCRLATAIINSYQPSVTLVTPVSSVTLILLIPQQWKLINDYLKSNTKGHRGLAFRPPSGLLKSRLETDFNRIHEKDDSGYPLRWLAVLFVAVRGLRQCNPSSDRRPLAVLRTFQLAEATLRHPFCLVALRVSSDRLGRKGLQGKNHHRGNKHSELHSL